MSQPALRRYWVRETYWLDDEHLEKFEHGNPLHRVPMFKAADVNLVFAQCLKLKRGERPGEWIDSTGNWVCDTEELPQRLLARLTEGS